MISITYALKCRLLSSLIHQIFCVVFIPYSVYLQFTYNRNEILTYTVGTAFCLKTFRLTFGFLTDLYIWNLLIMNFRTKEILDIVLCDQNRSKNIPSTDTNNIFDELIRSNCKSTNPVFTICDFFQLLIAEKKKGLIGQSCCLTNIFFVFLINCSD